MKESLPQEQLYERIVARIHLAQTRQNGIRLYCSFVVSVVSGLGLISAVFWLYRDLVSSGFLQTISLLFSDSGTVLAYWHDFLSSLLEFLPAVSLSVCLSSVVVFLLSLSYLLKYGRQAKQVLHVGAGFTVPFSNA